MEKYLSPKNIEDYNKKEFWDSAFQKYKSSYDWYGEYDDFQKYFATYMKKTDRILLVGCGNSTLGEKLYRKLGELNVGTTTAIRTLRVSTIARRSWRR